MFLGVDIGGTFTDLVMLDENGDLVTTKALSTPGELEVGVFNAVEDAARQRGMSGEELLAKVTAFGHGTTQATNAVIERDGARTGLIATRGFGDTLAIQRLMGFTAGVPVDRLGWYSRRRYPQPIVPRQLVREVRERVDHAGTILVPLDEEEVRAAVRSLVAEGVQTFAVAFLWGFAIRNTSVPPHGLSAKRRRGFMLACRARSRRSSANTSGPRPLRSIPISLRKSSPTLTALSRCCAARASRGLFHPELGRRRHAGFRGVPAAGHPRHVRPDRRRHGFSSSCKEARLPQSHYHGHGWHLVRRRHCRRRQAADVDQPRGWRIPYRDADDRGAGHWRRRWFHRTRHRRPTSRGARQRQRLAGPCMLQAWRHVADGHGCGCRSWRHRSRDVPWRQDEAGSRCRPHRDRDAHRQAARPFR
ncbi:hypothetical protein HED50_21025 [Ochrobactrum oryzae]|nr:hypothetical protein [Brucella oryzae]